jgi:hypothetical protein
MNKTPFNESPNSEDELLPEYQFDYKKAKSNRFASGSDQRQMTDIVPDEDVDRMFTTAESVNKVLLSKRMTGHFYP